MRSTLLTVGFLYFLLIANFYNESNGFTKFYGDYYAFWKITPIAFLAAFAFLHGGGMSEADRRTSGLALVFGLVGDYLIGLWENGIVAGSIPFGIGHILYLSMFAFNRTTLHYGLLMSSLAWSAIIGHFCLMPLLFTEPLNVAIMTGYSLLLTTCFVTSVSQHWNGTSDQTEEGVAVRALGFSFFFLSDSVLILTHTGYISAHLGELLILASYYGAQYLILYGNIVAKMGLVKIYNKIK